MVKRQERQRLAIMCSRLIARPQRNRLKYPHGLASSVTPSIIIPKYRKQFFCCYLLQRGVSPEQCLIGLKSALIASAGAYTNEKNRSTLEGTPCFRNYCCHSKFDVERLLFTALILFVCLFVCFRLLKKRRERQIF